MIRKLLFLLILFPLLTKAQAPTNDSTKLSAPTTSITLGSLYSKGVNASNTQIGFLNPATGKWVQLVTGYQFNHFGGGSNIGNSDLSITANRTLTLPSARSFTITAPATGTASSQYNQDNNGMTIFSNGAASQVAGFFTGSGTNASMSYNKGIKDATVNTDLTGIHIHDNWVNKGLFGDSYFGRNAQNGNAYPQFRNMDSTIVAKGDSIKATISGGTNIYNADGSLTGDRTVNMNGHSLLIGGTSSDFSVVSSDGSNNTGMSASATSKLSAISYVSGNTKPMAFKATSRGLVFQDSLLNRGPVAAKRPNFVGGLQYIPYVLIDSIITARTPSAYTAGYGMGLTSNAFRVDTTVIKSKAGFLADYNNINSNLALKLNKTDTTTAFANLVHKAGSETITGQKTFNKPLVFAANPTPTYAAGSLVYDSSQSGNNVLTVYNNDSNVGLQLGQEEWIFVTNNTGSTIANGSVVYINGSSGGVPTVALAQANSGTTTVGIGLTTESIANGASGYVTTIGVVHGLNTSSFVVGPVYISETTPGALTQTAPLAPNYRYRVGFVTAVSATIGQIQVTPSTASLGNGAANQLFGMNNAGTAQETKTISGTQGVVPTLSTPGSIGIGLGNITPTSSNTTHLPASIFQTPLGTANTDSIVVKNGGRLRAISPTAFGSSYTFSTGLTNTSGTITNNLSTGVSGGQTTIGGTGATDIFTHKGTTGSAGTTGVSHRFTGGNNGATTLLELNNDGSATVYGAWGISKSGFLGQFGIAGAGDNYFTLKGPNSFNVDFVTAAASDLFQIANNGTNIFTGIANGKAGIGSATAITTTFFNLPASTTAASSLRVAHGAAPTSPVNGDIWTTSAGGLFGRINGVTQNYAPLTSPSFTTPTLGVATATSINKVTITAPATSATLTIANGGTLQQTGAFTLNNTLTANSTPTYPAGAGTLMYIRTQTVTSASTLTVAYANDYVFTGTTSTYTLPAIAGGTVGDANKITIYNRGSGNITVNAASGSTIYKAGAAVSTFTLGAGVFCTLTPDGTYTLYN